MKTYLHYPMRTMVNCRDPGGMPTAECGVTDEMMTKIREKLVEY